MGFNVNIGQDPLYDGEYELFRSTTEELINIFGIKLTYIITKKVNKDYIFGEYSHIKIDEDSTFEIYAKPLETDNWGGEGDLFSKFGLQNLNSLSFYISRTDMEKIHPELVNVEGSATVDNLPNGNLIMLPNKALMEVTNFELTSDELGNNNIYTSDRHKNVYKITVKQYIANHDDYSEAGDLMNPEATKNTDMYDQDFGNLEAIFSDIDEKIEEVSFRAEDKVLADETIYPSNVRKKPIRSKVDEENPFGSFG